MIGFEISIICHHCYKQNIVVILDEVANYRCRYCDTRIISALRRIEGYVYILSNPSMPGLVKIGYTTRGVNQRIEELNAPTGVPEGFVVEAVFLCVGPRGEERIHQALEQYRLPGREFFRIELSRALPMIQAILSSEPIKLGKNSVGIYFPGCLGRFYENRDKGNACHKCKLKDDCREFRGDLQAGAEF